MYRPTAEIHLGRLKSNYHAIQKIVGGAKVLAIIKADAYGHGALRSAQALADAGTFGFGVAMLHEGLELRDGGINNFMLHLGRFSAAALPKYLEHDIRLSIHGMDDIEHLQAYHDETGAQFIAHLKIDTGMGRLGVPYEQAVDVLEAIKRCDFITLEGIFSHFATAAESEPSFMSYQMTRFGQFVHMVQKMKLPVEYFHIANSSAIFRSPESHFNMVRPGIGLYGVSPSTDVPAPDDFRPVMDLKAPLVMVKKMAKGSPVGYARAFRAPEPTNIGTVQIGYFDGVQYEQSPNGHIGIGDKVYSLVGKVSMDMSNINLGTDEPAIGSEALVWGESDDPRLNAGAQAEAASTQPYVLLTSVGSRVERIYVDD